MQLSAKPCYFCVNKKESIDYKNTDLLKTFISFQMKISKRKRSGLCAKHQRKIAQAIKRSRVLGLFPFVPS